MASHLYFGIGAATELHAFLPPVGAFVLLLTGKGSYGASGAAETVDPLLSRHAVRHFRVTSPDPSIEEVEVAVSRYGDPVPELVIAVGGGTVIDTAKLVALALGASQAPADLLDGHTRHLPSVDIVAIPTTAGSGAERTHFAVVYSAGTKYSVAADSIRPTAALVDPLFTYSLSRSQTAASGFDALAHAMETLWSINATTESKALSEEALSLTWSNLVRATTQPDPDSRWQMALGATQAGAALDIARSTAPHALAYHLTSRHGLDHGHAVALTLGAFLEYNAGVTADDVVHASGPEVVLEAVRTVCSILGVDDATAGRAVIDRCARELGLVVPDALSSAVALDEWAANINAERMVNNPRKVTDESLRGLLESVT